MNGLTDFDAVLDRQFGEIRDFDAVLDRQFGEMRFKIVTKGAEKELIHSSFFSVNGCTEVIPSKMSHWEVRCQH
jgi:hypothetical protein